MSTVADKARCLIGWLDEVLRGFVARILPVDTAAARRWGRLAAVHGHAGVDPLDCRHRARAWTDAAIRNTRHSAGTDVSLVDPFAMPQPG
jgi:hypothetical protein